MTELFYDPLALTLKAALLGAVLGAVYDVFRIIRIAGAKTVAPKGVIFEKIKLPPAFFGVSTSEKPRKYAKNVVIFIEDMAFFIICAAAQTLFFLGENNGEIRIYCLIFSLIGFLIYHLTLGRLVIYFSSAIIFFSKCLLYWMIYIIIIPIKFISHAVFRFLTAVFAATVGKIVMLIKKKRSKSLKKAILAEAAECFGIIREVKSVEKV